MNPEAEAGVIATDRPSVSQTIVKPPQTGQYSESKITQNVSLSVGVDDMVGVSFTPPPRSKKNATTTTLSTTTTTTTTRTMTMTGRMSEELRTYQLAPLPRSAARLIWKCVKCGDLNLSFIVYDSLVRSGGVPDADVLWAIIEAGRKCGQPAMSLHRVMDAIEKYGLICTKTANLSSCFISLIRAIDEGDDHTAAKRLIVWLGQLQLHPAETDSNSGSGSGSGSGSPLRALSSSSRSGLGVGLGPNSPLFPNTIQCNTLITVVSRGGYPEHSFDVLELMDRHHIPVTLFTYLTVLSACARMNKPALARKVQDHIMKRRVLIDVKLMTALLSCHADFGELDTVFDLLQECTTRRLQLNVFMYMKLLNVCTRTAAYNFGLRIHEHAVNNAVIKRNGTQPNVVYYTALLDMHMGCGMVEEAESVFELLLKPQKGRTAVADVVAYNAIINGYALNGRVEQAIAMYKKMKTAAVTPNSRTVMCAMMACSHGGEPDEALRILKEMGEMGFQPDVMHHTAILDALGRSGRLDEAEAYLQSMTPGPNIVSLMAVLGACRTRGDVDRADRIFNRILSLPPSEQDYGHVTAAHVLKGNTFAHSRQWEDRDRVWTQMRERGLRSKEPGVCRVEVGGKLHTFYVDDTRHPDYSEMRRDLQDLLPKLKAVGYRPATEWVTRRDGSEEEMEAALCGHSEKLAIVYALRHISPQDGPIRIVKNLRVCGDCHEATKFITLVYPNQQIIVRDANRFHHYINGKCSCGDYF